MTGLLEAGRVIILLVASFTGPDAPAEGDQLTDAMIRSSQAAVEARYECESYPIYEWFSNSRGAGIWIGAACESPEAAGGYVYSEGRWTFEIHED